MKDYIKIGESLVAWYDQNKRDLPWRKTQDPYKIWISEIMLQQTRVDTVIDYYHRFLAIFPDVKSLALAEEDSVLNAWKGLGYYSRARNLHKAAKMILKEYGGVFPAEADQLRKLPGIGAYTLGSIMSIAFEKPLPAVDGNVLRVVSRLETLAEDITKESTKKKVADTVARMIPSKRRGDFCQAMMELGATVCSPLTPACPECPLQSFCNAFQSATWMDYPVKAREQKPLKRLSFWSGLIFHEDKILMEYREKATLLGKMWGVPQVEKKEAKTIAEAFLTAYRLQFSDMRELGEVKHIFTHQVWHMEVFATQLSVPLCVPEGLAWVPVSQVAAMTVPTCFQKVLRLGLPMLEL